MKWYRQLKQNDLYCKPPAMLCSTLFLADYFNSACEGIYADYLLKYSRSYIKDNVQ